MAKIEFFILIL